MPAIPIIYSASSSRQPRRQWRPEDAAVPSDLVWEFQQRESLAPPPAQELSIDAVADPLPAGLLTTSELRRGRRLRRSSSSNSANARRSTAPPIPEYLTPLTPLDSLISEPWSESSTALAKRNFVFVPLPAIYKGLNAGPSPGVMVGIVLGSVGGFLLIVWLVWFVATVSWAGGGLIQGEDTEIVVERHHSSHRSKSEKPQRRRRRKHRRRSSSPSTPSARSPARPSPRRERTERIIVDETVRRTVSQSQSRPPPARSERETVRESVIVEESSTRRVPGDDEVIVEEEHSEISEERPARRKKSAKSGYRTVDPNAYGGGNYVQREVIEKKTTRR